MIRGPAFTALVLCLALLGCSSQADKTSNVAPASYQAASVAPSSRKNESAPTLDRVARRPEIQAPVIPRSNADLPLWPPPAPSVPVQPSLSPPNALPPTGEQIAPPWASLPGIPEGNSNPGAAPLTFGPTPSDTNPLRALDAPQTNPLRGDFVPSLQPTTSPPAAAPQATFPNTALPLLPAAPITTLPQLPKPGASATNEVEPAAPAPSELPSEAPTELKTEPAPLLPHAPAEETESAPPRVPQARPIVKSTPARLPRVSIYSSPKALAEAAPRLRSAPVPAAPPAPAASPAPAPSASAPTGNDEKPFEPSGGAAPPPDMAVPALPALPPLPRTEEPPPFPAFPTPPAPAAAAPEEAPAPLPTQPAPVPTAAIEPAELAAPPLASVAPIPVDVAPATPLPESAIAESNISQVIPAAAATEEPFDVVRVFYGTDRRPILLNEDTLVARLVRFVPSAVLIALAVIGIGVVFVSRKITWFIGTTALVVLSVISIWNGISETIAIAEQASLEEPKYSTDRSYNGRIDHGMCEVSIPKTHEPGELESPTILRLETRFDPARHITLRKTSRLQDKAFYDQIRQQVANSPDREILVFVHGFNVSFDDAARRTAQMAHDLKLQGAPVFFSWPADRGFLLTYGKDEASVSWATPHLKAFLLDLVHETDAKAINLVAHSMGNRALTTALREIDLELRDEARLFNQVVLAAPDIDADDFRENIAPAIQRTAKQVTLYASSNDIALGASRILHRNARAGDASQGLVLVPGIVTIDVSNIDGGPWGHSYYGASDPVLRDLHLLLTSLPPERRTWLKMNQVDGQTYWAFKPLGTARTPALVEPR